MSSEPTDADAMPGDPVGKPVKRSFPCQPNDPDAKLKSQKRILVAADCLAQGMTSPEIVKFLCAEHDTSWRAAYRDISKARKRLAKGIAKRGTDEAVGEAIIKAEAHYTRCVKHGDLRTGLETLKHLAHMTGALHMAEVLIQQQINSVQIGAPSAQLATELQSLSGDELSRYVLGELQRASGNGREVIEATVAADDN